MVKTFLICSRKCSFLPVCTLRLTSARDDWAKETMEIIMFRSEKSHWRFINKIERKDGTKNRCIG